MKTFLHDRKIVAGQVQKGSLVPSLFEPLRRKPGHFDGLPSPTDGPQQNGYRQHGWVGTAGPLSGYGGLGPDRNLNDLCRDEAVEFREIGIEVSIALGEHTVLLAPPHPSACLFSIPAV